MTVADYSNMEIENLCKDLKDLAEKHMPEMSANVHEKLWNLIQGLEHDNEVK